MLALPQRPPKRGVINEVLSGFIPWVALNLCRYLLPCQYWQWWTQGRQLTTPRFITQKEGKAEIKGRWLPCGSFSHVSESSSYRFEWWRNDGPCLSQTKTLTTQQNKSQESLPGKLYTGLFLVKSFTSLTNRENIQRFVCLFVCFPVHSYLRKMQNIKDTKNHQSMQLAHTKLLFISGECTVSFCKTLLNQLLYNSKHFRQT